MYGKIPERKLKETDYNLSCEETRKQLDEYLDTQNRRVNVDSAKKLAVLQHMDYEGFRQMVLGANIFPTKSKELNNFSMGIQPQKAPQNKLFTDLKLQEAQTHMQGNSQKHCNNFRDFKNKFKKSYDKELTWQKAEECYSLVKQQDQSRLQKIFNLECEADILVKVIDVFQFVVSYLRKQQKQDLCQVECGFMVTFLEMVLRIPTMQDISLNILTKKQKQRIVQFLTNTKEVLRSEEEQTSIDKVIGLIAK